MGTKLSAMFGDCTKEQAFAVLDEFFEAGGCVRHVLSRCRVLPG